jgi:hypothetical protein
MKCGNVPKPASGFDPKKRPVEISRSQTNLTKAARFVIRNLGHGQLRLAGTISNAVRRYGVNQHDLWLRIQLTDH